MDSDEKEVSVDEFGQICRICLLSNSPLQSIPQELLNLLKSITDIEFKTDDDLPQNLCWFCVKQLEDIRTFIEKCKHHHSLLLLALKQKFNAFFNTDILDDSCDSGNDNDFFIHPIKSENHDTVTKKSSEIIKKNAKLSCAECGSKFSLKKYLLRHISWHCRALKYSCEICSLKCKSQEALQMHSDTHCISNVFLCYICCEDFSTSALMYKHLRIKHKISSTDGVSNFPCKKCDRILTSLGSLTYHMRTHTGEKPFSCMYCNKAFAYPNSLTIHTRIHTGETPFICKICKKSFRSSTTLKKHQLKEHNEFNIFKGTCTTNAEKTKKKEAKEMQCKVCHKKLFKQGLGAHMRVHLVVKKEFICGICNKQFQKNSHLERHMRIHTGERPYNCSYCDKTFTQDNDLKRHLASHTNEKEFQCQHCGKRYYSKSALSVHLYTHTQAKKTPKPPCNDCAAYSITCRHGIDKANKTHLCTVCGKSFTAKSSLIVHTRLHTGVSPFPCSSCDKKYVTSSALKKHVMRNHTGVKSHICMVCQKSYYDSFSLKQHMDKVHAILEFKIEAEEIELI